MGSSPATSLISPQGTISMRWDATRAGLGIYITEGGQSVYLKEQSYVFRTVIAEAVMTLINLVLYQWSPLLGDRRRQQNRE